MVVKQGHLKEELVPPKATGSYAEAFGYRDRVRIRNRKPDELLAQMFLFDNHPLHFTINECSMESGERIFLPTSSKDSC